MKNIVLVAVAAIVAVAGFAFFARTTSADFVFISDLNVICDRRNISMAFSKDPSGQDRVFIRVSCEEGISERSVLIKADAIRDPIQHHSAIKHVLAAINEPANVYIDMKNIFQDAGWRNLEEDS
jgi:hypothetical protein